MTFHVDGTEYKARPRLVRLAPVRPPAYVHDRPGCRHLVMNPASSVCSQSIPSSTIRRKRGLEVGGDRGSTLAARLEDDPGRRVRDEDHCRLAGLPFQRLADFRGDVEELRLAFGPEDESPHREVPRTLCA
jgi:hypothetical protein